MNNTLTMWRFLIKVPYLRKLSAMYDMANAGLNHFSSNENKGCNHRLYMPYGCETAVHTNRFIMEYQCLYVGFVPQTFSFVNISNSS